MRNSRIRFLMATGSLADGHKNTDDGSLAVPRGNGAGTNGISPTLCSSSVNVDRAIRQRTFSGEFHMNLNHLRKILLLNPFRCVRRFSRTVFESRALYHAIGILITLSASLSRCRHPYHACQHPCLEVFIQRTSRML